MLWLRLVLHHGTYRGYLGPNLERVVNNKKTVCRPKLDHTEAKAIYEAYLVKAAELKRYQEYATMVAKATHGLSMTPVQPLATLGTDGGPLRCDHCLRPMILEGGQFHGVYVDEAWKRASPTVNQIRWLSYIKGGMVVYIAENETLRIYHGYERNPNDCCSVAIRELRAASDSFVKDTSKGKLINHFLEDEFQDMDMKERNRLFSDIFRVMFSFDPGLGVNRPCQQS